MLRVFDHKVRKYDSNSDYEITPLGFDEYIIFQDRTLFDFTSDLSEVDIVVLDVSLRAGDVINDTVVKFSEHNQNCGVELPADFVNFFHDFTHKCHNKPILIFTNDIWHLQEPNITVLQVSFISEMVTLNLPVRNILFMSNQANISELDIFSDYDLITEKKLKKTARENFIYVDYLFNRSHAVHHHQDIMARLWQDIYKLGNWWGHEKEFDRSKYALSDDSSLIDRNLFHSIKKRDAKEEHIKLYVCPNNTQYRNYHESQEGKYHHRGYLRVQLADTLKSYPGYLGDPFLNLPLISDSDKKISVSELLFLDGNGFAPPHNAYYNATSLSFYVETLTYHSQYPQLQCYTPTEKTWTPLNKGHMILPYGPHGFCDFLKSHYDIKFPEFMDLEYDSISDNKLRSETYLAEVRRLCDMGAEKLYNLKEENLDLIIHNRNVCRQGYRYDISNYLRKYDV